MLITSMQLKDELKVHRKKMGIKKKKKLNKPFKKKIRILPKNVLSENLLDYQMLPWYFFCLLLMISAV